MAQASPDQVRTLAERYEPTLVFSTGERIFPALVESYLSHVSPAAWPSGRGQPARDLGVPAESRSGPSHRGTAIMEGPPPAATRLGGPSPAGAPLRRDASGADAIGASSYRVGRASETLFLTFGGWSDDTYRAGNAEYVQAAFSELTAAMAPEHQWGEFESLANRPLMWVEQPTAPTLYAEAAWCGDYPGIDEAVDRGGSDARDFTHPEDPDSLRRILALTYYLFFPLMDLPTAPQAEPSLDLVMRRREGQWEAATVFLAGTAPPPPWPTGPSDGREKFDFMEPPIAVALSRDPNVKVDLATCQPWSGVTCDGLHPRLYVSRGRHHLLFAAPSDQAGNYEGPGGGASADTRLDTTDPGQEDFPGSEVLLVLGLIFGSPWLLLLWLISVFLGMHNDENTGAEGPPPDVSGPAGDGEGSVATPSQEALPGQVLADGRRIDDPATTLLRFINGLVRDPPRTSWPDDEDPGSPPPPFEYPYWWDFAGRWGVAIPRSTTWSSGTRRVDRFGRSLGYFNTVSLTLAWAQGRVDRP